jgi:pilus assembly protein CpaE
MSTTMDPQRVAADRLPPIVTVVSPKGGSGKTAIASNLALAFAQRTPSILVDLDTYTGDVEWAFGVRPAFRLHDVARRFREDSATELEGMFTPYGAQLALLCGPDSHIAADGVYATDMRSVNQRLFSLNRPVVFDTSPGLSDFTVDAMEMASRVLLVTTTDVASVQAARKLLDTMRVLNLPTERVSLAVNRSTARSGLSMTDVETRLGFPISLNIPDNSLIPASLNAGTPLMDSHPESHISDSVQSFADSLLGVTLGKRMSFWWKRKL